ncbi:MAG: thrombospondin type 3 repeat-containing protein, partial [Gammaproteobacteria bacterium]|nr:thrombospondin type 3 repeat-containing protein [Gammaproteobacteria bacterium]
MLNISHCKYIVIITLTLMTSHSAMLFAAPVFSDGSDGAFNLVASQTINLDVVAPDGIFNFTTINIPFGVEVKFIGNTLNTPVFFSATGDVVIDGRINVSAGNFNGGAGPGGGGLATEGLIATQYSGGNPAPGGDAVARPELILGISGGGGSGGVGGGSGGGLQISTLGNITISGELYANGGHAGWSFANVFSHGGPGGGLSTQPVPNDPYVFSNLAHGGLGYLSLSGTTISIDPGAIIDAKFSVSDIDGDGIGNNSDNCILVPNPAQRDTDGDGFGNFCDADLNGDFTVDLSDFSLLRIAFSTADPDADFNGDGTVDLSDFSLFRVMFGSAPGPSCC